MVVGVIIEKVDELVVILSWGWLSNRMSLLAVVAIYDQNDTLFLGQVTVAKELSEVAADQVCLFYLVNHLLEGSIPHVLLLVEDAGEQLKSGAG